MSEPDALTNSSLTGYVREHRFVVIHFWAKWNGYDSLMKLALERIPAEIGNLVAIGTLDTDPQEHWDLVRSHRVLNLPFLAFYRDGELVSTLTGMRPDNVLHTLVRDLVNSSGQNVSGS